jgi:hypothetical protein
MIKNNSMLGVLIVVLILIPNYFIVETVNSSSPDINENRCGKGFRYNIQGWVYLHVEGEPWERGYQYAYLASDEIMDMMHRWSNLGHNFGFMKIFIKKNQPKNYYQISEQWWNICRSESIKKFFTQVPNEYIQEMQGMTEGLKDKNAKIFDREIEFEDVFALQFVQDVQYTLAKFHKGIHPIKDILHGLKEIASKDILKNEGHCNAFIATGDATTNGEIVVAHATIFSRYIAQRCNFIVDIQPSEGYRFMMTSPPGSLWSQEDWYQNDQGIILTETETIPQGPWNIKDTIPKGVRSRKAIQYSDSIDAVIKNLAYKNNGLIPNEWLIGDKKTGEIASYHQALYNTPIKRTFNGYYHSNCLAHDANVLSELTGVPQSILKIYSKLSAKNGYFYIQDDKVIWKDEVYQKLKEFGEKYYGKIDINTAKEIMTTYPITDRTTDCKITTSELMKNFGMIVHIGSTDGLLWTPSNEEQEKYKGITELIPNGWLEIYPIISKVKNLLPEKKADLNKVNTAIILNEYTTTKKEEKQIESNTIYENIKIQIDYDKIILTDIEDKKEIFICQTNGKISSKPKIDESTIYLGSWDGNIYAYDLKTGKIKWKYQTGWGVVTTPAISEDILFAGSLDNNFYAVDKHTGDLIWHFTCNAAIHSSPIVYADYVFFGCDDGRLYALDKLNGDCHWIFSPEYTIDDNDVNNYITTPITADPYIQNGLIHIDIKEKTFTLDPQTYEEKTDMFKDKEHLFKNYGFISIIPGFILLTLSICFYLYSTKKK